MRMRHWLSVAVLLLSGVASWAIVPPFATVWNASYEAIPADTESESLGASRIRDLKVQLRSRLNQDMSWAGNGNDGYHNRVTLLTQPSAPLPQLDAGATGGFLYSSLVNSNAELFYGDSNGHQLQVSSNGGLAVTPTSFHVPTTTVLTTASTSPYVPPAGAAHLWVRIVGGGSGGGAGNNATLSNSGQSTTFSGSGGVAMSAGGASGSSTTVVGGGGNFSGCDFGLGGGTGQGASALNVTGISTPGGNGGSGPFGGQGSGIIGLAGSGAVFNSGAGGGGGGVAGAGGTLGMIAGSGGSAGGYCEKTIGSLATSYTFAVGQGGSGVTGTAPGQNGGTGGAGIIIIQEFYF